MKKKLLLFGGGGHCKSVLDSILSLDIYDELGIVDFDASLSILGVPVVGNDYDLPELVRDGWCEGFITVGSVGSTSIRRKIYELMKEFGIKTTTIIDPTAIVASEVTIGEGSYIGKRSVLNKGSKVGCCTIINTGSIIEHDCEIGDFSHISSNATLCGQVIVGHDSHVGAGSVIRQEIKIGNNSLIGIGSVVVKDIPANVKAYGNPCKVVE